MGQIMVITFSCDCDFLFHPSDSRAATPTPTDQDARASDTLPVVELTNTELNQDAAEEGQSFAKRIVAEILDRSVTRYRNTVVGDSKEGEEGTAEESGGQKNNYINYDIAQTVLGSSKDVLTYFSEEKTDDEMEGSRTPTG